MTVWMGAWLIGIPRVRWHIEFVRLRLPYRVGVCDMTRWEWESLIESVYIKRLVEFVRCTWRIELVINTWLVELATFRWLIESVGSTRNPNSFKKRWSGDCGALLLRRIRNFVVETNSLCFIQTIFLYMQIFCCIPLCRVLDRLRIHCSASIRGIHHIWMLHSIGDIKSCLKDYPLHGTSDGGRVGWREIGKGKHENMANGQIISPIQKGSAQGIHIYTSITCEFHV